MKYKFILSHQVNEVDKAFLLLDSSGWLVPGFNFRPLTTIESTPTSSILDREIVKARDKGIAASKFFISDIASPGIGVYGIDGAGDSIQELKSSHIWGI